MVEAAGKLPVASHSDLAEFFGRATFSEAGAALTVMVLKRVHLDDEPTGRWVIVMTVQFSGTCNKAVLPPASTVMVTGLVETIGAAGSNPTPDKKINVTHAANGSIAVLRMFGNGVNIRGFN